MPLFAFAGHSVTREFYVNDYGTQMTKFALSLAARYAQLMGIDLAVPEDGYQGEYVIVYAERLAEEVGERYRDAVAVAAPDADALPPGVVEEIKLWGRDRVLVVA